MLLLVDFGSMCCCNLHLLLVANVNWTILPEVYSLISLWIKQRCDRLLSLGHLAHSIWVALNSLEPPLFSLQKVELLLFLKGSDIVVKKLGVRR